MSILSAILLFGRHGVNKQNSLELQSAHAMQTMCVYQSVISLEYGEDDLRVVIIKLGERFRDPSELTRVLSVWVNCRLVYSQFVYILPNKG